MREPSYGWAAALGRVLQAIPLLALSSCVLIVSTSPTTVSGANIVFVARDDNGGAVASVHITLVDVFGEWREDGLTARDGSYHCAVGAGVTRVRAEVQLPSGFVLVSSGQWPHEMDIPPGGILRLEIRVR